MVGFLINHDKYSTMNSWNHGKSFSNCIKVHHLDLPADVQDVMFDATQDELMYEDLKLVIEDFEEDYNHNFTMGHNGRSGGYLVLYKMAAKDTGYKSQCSGCHRCSKNKVDPAREPFGICSNCGQPRVTNLKKPIFRYHATGQGYGEDYRYEEEYLMDKDEWDMSSLRDEVKFIKDFDEACSNYVEAFVGWCRENLIQPVAISA